MARMAVVNTAERIRQSGACWDMIAVTFANGSSGTAQPRAMNSTSIRNQPADTYDAMRSFMKQPFSNRMCVLFLLQVVNPKFSTYSNILLPLRLVLHCRKLLRKPRTNFYRKLRYRKRDIRSSTDRSCRGWRISAR